MQKVSPTTSLFTPKTGRYIPRIQHKEQQEVHMLHLILPDLLIKKIASAAQKAKGHRPESSKPAQPATKVYSRVKPKGKLPEYLDFQGVRHYWKPVEVKTN